MKSRSMLAVLIAVLALAFLSCGAPQAGQSGSGAALDGGKGAASPAVSGSLAEPEPLVMPDGKPAAAHAKYLSDPSGFSSLPEGIPKGRTVAVIGSDVARLFEYSKPMTNEEAGALRETATLPVGTLLAVGEPVTSSHEDLYGLFEFEGHYNYFYPVTHEGKRGLVFGADLHGLGDSADRNRVAAMRYRENGRFSAFYPVHGLDPIPGEEVEALAGGRMTFRRTEWRGTTDEMFGLYAVEAENRLGCLFLTTDIAAHGLHLLFDRFLQRVEQDRLAPRLASLIDGYLAEIGKLKAADDGKVPEYSLTLDLAEFYFLVPKATLELRPATSRDEGGKEAFAEVDAEAILRKYPADVRATVAFMDAHEGFETIPRFLYKEDFSQYKPRGHYTRNGVLSSYFRTMMWFGRVHAYVALNGAQPYVWKTDGALSSSTELTLRLAPMAVLINDVTRRNPGLLAAWRSLFDPITSLIGVSDDLGFDDTMPFIDRQGIADLKKWSADEDAIRAFARKAAAELKPPAISGNSVLYVPSGESGTPPMGWRLFGQRFTHDSAVHMAVSSPRMFDPGTLRGRDFVAGLDVMKAFGSREADALLAKWDNGYAPFKPLEGTLDAFERDFSSRGEDFWGKTYYNRTLFMVKAQANFERGAGFYFTETPLWSKKALLSAHGTWAELRHDTILYVKQVYGAEMSGGGDIEPTFRTREIPAPVHYVEPNVPFWTGARLALRDLRETAASHDLLPDAYADSFEAVEGILARLSGIAALEYRDEEVSSEDSEFIRSVPGRLSLLCNPESPDGYGDPDQDDRAGIIADIYTAVEPGLALEVGIASPYRIQVLLNDGQGGKRVGVGYCYGYHEFYHPMSDRLTDEQWKEMAYAPGADLEKYGPFWMAEVPVLPAAGNRR